MGHDGGWGRDVAAPDAGREGMRMIALRVEVGSTVPDVTLQDMEGNAYRLAELRGRRLLLFMWASW